MTLDDLLADAAASGIAVDVLERSHVAAVVTGIRDTYREPSARWALWEGLDGASVQSSSAWSQVGRYFGARPVLLLFPVDEGMAGVGLRSGDALDTLLNAAYGFVFYAVDPDLSGVLAYNDHDYLIGCGAAAAFVTHLRDVPDH